MNAVKKVVGVCLAALVLTAIGASPAGAEVIRVGEGGQPLASGHLETQGALHCQPVADFIVGEGAKAPGVIVVHRDGSFVLGAPQGGVCEEIYHAFTGE